MRNLSLSIPASAFLLSTTAVPIAQADFSLSPTFPSAILSHSRTSLATMFDSTGKLTYAPNNLLEQSNTFSDASWTKSTMTVTSGVTDPLGGSNATRLTATGATSYIYQPKTVPTGANALTSIWVRRVSGSGTINLWTIIGNTGTAIVPTSTWTQYYVAGAVSSGTAAFAGVIIQTSGDVIEVYAATASAVTYETTPRTADQVITTSSAYYGPRIDYDPNTLAVKGLLIEEARTNLVVDSNQFVSWTISGGSSVATNSNTQIDGTTNGNTFSLVAGVSGHQIYKSYTGTAVAYTNSVYAKAGTSSWLGMWFASTAQADGAFFNLSNGTIGTVAAGTTAAIQSIGNGWYRCSITKTLTAATYYNGLEVHTADNQAYNFNAAGTESLYLFGAQGELGSFATSYIPTAAASVTRAADVVQFTGAALTALQGSLWTFFVEATAQAPYSTNPALWGNNGNNLVQLDSSGHTNFYLGGNLAQPTNTATAFAAFRSGTSKTATGTSAVLNGGAINKFTGAVTPVLTTVSLGTAISTNKLNGWFKSFAIYSQALPDATLQAKSVVGASYL